MALSIAIFNSPIRLTTFAQGPLDSKNHRGLWCFESSGGGRNRTAVYQGMRYGSTVRSLLIGDSHVL